MTTRAVAVIKTGLVSAKTEKDLENIFKEAKTIVAAAAPLASQLRKHFDKKVISTLS
jgi:hypothetical protein